MLLTTVFQPLLTLSLASMALTAYGHPSPSIAGSGTLSRRATTCNGHAELCDRSFGNVSFVGAHDSYAIGVNNLAVNQDQTITQQLNDGIRMLQSQAHNENGVLKLCHTSCGLYDGGTLADYLKTVKSWMDANPTEVLSLLIVNIDNAPASAYDTVFKSAGLDTMSYAPSQQTLPASGWPTLGSLIDSGKRLLTFLDHQATPDIPYLLDEFSNIWETAFDVTDPTFDCEVNRTAGDTSTQMYLINHFLDKITFGAPVPDISKANVTNAATGAGSLGEQVSKCTGQHGRPPNFLLVDFYEFGGGSVFQVAADINGVQYKPSSPAAKPLPTNGTATTSGGTVKVTSSPIGGSKSGSMSLTFSPGQSIAAFAASIALLVGPLLVL